GVLGFSWDASQGVVVGGVLPAFTFPYVHVLRIDEATKTRIDEPIIYSPTFAVQWSSLAANASGDLGGAVMWGGGSFEENCAAVIHDSAVTAPAFWEFHTLGSSSSDTAQAKSGDYTTSRGVGNGWVSACYLVSGSGDSGSVHPHSFSYGRQDAGPPPPPP